MMNVACWHYFIVFSLKPILGFTRLSVRLQSITVYTVGRPIICDLIEPIRFYRYCIHISKISHSLKLTWRRWVFLRLSWLWIHVLHNIVDIDRHILRSPNFLSQHHQQCMLHIAADSFKLYLFVYLKHPICMMTVLHEFLLNTPIIWLCDWVITSSSWPIVIHWSCISQYEVHDMLKRWKRTSLAVVCWAKQKLNM